jgi:hypothetical protein
MGRGKLNRLINTVKRETPSKYIMNMARKYNENEKKYKELVEKTEHIKFYRKMPSLIEERD